MSQPHTPDRLLVAVTCLVMGLLLLSLIGG